jgi:hypothetical protein
VSVFTDDSTRLEEQLLQKSSLGLQLRSFALEPINAYTCLALKWLWP